MKTCFVFGLSALMLSCSGSKEMSIQVGNDAPELSIISPLDGTQFNEYELIEFVGRTTDLEDAEVDLDVIWFSSIDGELHTESPDEEGNVYFATSDLTPGDHAITLTVTDTQGLTANTSISVSIEDQEDAPTLELRSPVQSTGEENVPLVFQVAVDDVQDAPEDLLVSFQSDVDGEFCTPVPDSIGVAGCESTLTVGVHQLSFAVTDSHEFTTSEEMELTIFPSTQVDNDFDGFTEEEGDCDDTVPTTNPDGVEIHNGIDDDCDQLIDEETEAYDDDQDGFTELQGDCDDGNFDVYPSAQEECDGVDQDCNGVIDNDTDCFDDDQDGFTEDDGDCDDYDANINPIQSETFNSIDDDCNGIVDDNTIGYDDDGDGQTEIDGDCDDSEPGVYYGATETCDGVDQDCDTIIDNDTLCYDDDQDGYTEQDGDCDDYQPNSYPGNIEVADGVDNNCDGDIDEGTVNFDDDGDCFCEDLPCYGSITANCSTLSDGDCNDIANVIYPGAPETCNSIDEDCDGVADNNPIDPLTWYYDGDGDLRGDPNNTTLACTQPTNYVSNSNDCNDSEALAWTSAPEVCDGVDNDCDNATDENVTTTYYRDLDGDGYGTVGQSTEACTVPNGFVANANDCDDSCGTCYPGHQESCDGVDNNCDGTVDEINASGCVDYYQDLDGDGFGSSSSQCQCGPSGDYDTVITGDCHDNGTLAEITYPGAPFSDSEDPRGDNGTFDWDCDGDDEEYEYDEPSEDCGGYFSSSCRAGWQGGNPGCGQTARLSTSCSNSWFSNCSFNGNPTTQRCQ